jgi:hypothetical protein
LIEPWLCCRISAAALDKVDKTAAKEPLQIVKSQTHIRNRARDLAGMKHSEADDELG